MTHWNYRVMRRKIGAEILYGIHEVFYDKDVNPEGWSEDPIRIVEESPQDLQQTLDWMQVALKKPILDYHAGTIDWKHLATTPGYISLKAAYIRDVQRNGNKARYLRKFNWVIGRAQHYALKHNVSIETILNQWEEERKYWWLNYYQDCNQPKLHSSRLQPKNYNRPLKSKKHPPRWTSDYRNFKRSVS